ncbi:phage head spike fiber domain-containing protein [Atlantibacter hermannii]|uniref:phage head spike fiber domain-containing protein n=1 Tax=Atlantibacter hermannii TaxID=565 RepID=UPI003334988E
MSQFSEGDAAITRLTAATDAFEKVLTEPEGTIVPMPVGQPQPSLAERLKRALDAVTVQPAQAAAQAEAAAQQALQSAAAAAQSAADASNSAAATGYVDAPFPDVWAPLSDSLQLLAGSAPADMLTIGGTSYPLKTKSISFTRATTATYIDKTGALQTAVINEARFEKEGLLIEGVSTNLFLNSSDPSKWGNSALLSKTQQNDGSTQAMTGVFTASSDISNAANIITNTANPVALSAGGQLSGSCNAKSSYGRLRFRVQRVSGEEVANCVVDLTTGQLTPASNIALVATLKSDGYYRVEATFTATDADNYVVQFRYIPASGSSIIPQGSVIYLQMPQLEVGGVSSYIPTTDSTVTRGEDVANLTAINGGLDNATIACTVTRKWTPTSPPNSAPRIFSTRGGVAGSAWDAAFNNTGSANSFGGQTNSGALVAGFVDGQVFTSIKTPAGLTTMTPAGKNAGSQTTSPGFVSPLYLGNTKELNRPLFGHIRNLRIWHSVLSDIQIKGLR